MKNSVFQMIQKNINKDGILKEGFSLPAEDTGNGINWAAGAYDGVMLYHMGHTEPDAEARETMTKAITLASSGAYEKAEEIFAEWTKDNRAVAAVDVLQNYIYDHRQELDPNHIHGFAMHMILDSEHIECVKIGLEILELFPEPEEEIKQIVRTLALYDEFTLFCIWDMLKWSAGNEEIFELARLVHSWGRIHAVEKLNADNREKQYWLLTQGTVNNVTNAYSSLTCWKKSQAEKILAGKPSGNEYRGLALLIDGLLDEGPVPGISALNEPEKVLQRFIEIAPEYDLRVQEYEVILKILDRAEQEEHNDPALAKACEAILHSRKCRDTVSKAVVKGKGLQLADILNIPYREQLYRLMRRSFSEYYYYCRLLMADDEYREKTLQMFREKLPLKTMTGKPTDETGLGKKYLPHLQLDMIMRELWNTPLTGTDLIITGLKSPLPRNRIGALRVIQTWVQGTGTPLAALSSELYKTVKKLEPKEVNDTAKEMIAGLLEGKIEFENKQ